MVSATEVSEYPTINLRVFAMTAITWSRRKSGKKSGGNSPRHEEELLLFAGVGGSLALVVVLEVEETVAALALTTLRLEKEHSKRS